MIRNDCINLYFQRKNDLTMHNPIYSKHTTDLFHWMVEADAIESDRATTFLGIKGSGKAIITAKQEGIIAGIEEISFLIKQFTDLTIHTKVSDGLLVTADTIILAITGSTIDILAYERTFLNILGRMSGIATDTYNYVSQIKHVTNDPPLVAATRKTPWMLLDKKAVSVGGGLTHRLSLSDWALIKDNHLELLKKELQTVSSERVITEAVKRMMSLKNTFFEIEVETISEAITAITTFEKYRVTKEKRSMAILLDNFDKKKATECVKKLREKPGYQSTIIEASGGITKNALSSWAKTGVDIFSMGSLTHSSQTFNFSMSIT